jgi:hypothetical protein
MAAEEALNEGGPDWRCGIADAVHVLRSENERHGIVESKQLEELIAKCFNSLVVYSGSSRHIVTKSFAWDGKRYMPDGKR